MRIKKHPILKFNYSKKIPFYFNDKKTFGYPDDTIASALHAQNIRHLSTSIRYKNPRGFFCGIGKCSSCLMKVNGVTNVRTCIAPLKEGIHVKRQDVMPDIPVSDFKENKIEDINVDVLVIGGGPAGLSACVELARIGASVLLVDENQKLGGQLVKQTHKFFGSKNEKAGTRGIHIAECLSEEINVFEKKSKVKKMLGSTIIGFYENKNNNIFRFAAVKKINYENFLYDIRCKKVVFATGAMENMLVFPGNDLPGVYGAGGVQTLMNVYGVKPGEKVVMVGAGNVGLIVSYQLLQAGIDVDRVVEAMPYIGGYHVHAAKLRRCGVPILTRHSIKEVFGNSKVEGCVTIKLDENWNEIPGSEEKIRCDTICLAVGLTPSIRLLSQLDVKIDFIPEAGGYIALHDKNMQTTKKGVFIAGDSSGIEEASTAMIEGKIAGVSAALQLGYNTKKCKKLRDEYIKELEGLRMGPFGKKPRIAKEKIMKKLSEKKNI